MCMYYVYVLLSTKTNRLYTGYTENLRRRFQEHQSGNGGKYTTINKPFKLVYYEAFLEKKDATKQELFYKSGYGREVLNQKIEYSRQAALVHW
jgi:putative endonuclease